ncbi:hypothetical protein [Agromyces sp. NPDC058126]|uniref:hypothetical protein n=1 Tax=Agromyces sp. NPDC058126 TaxID=3346350 RepID=UPI0036D95AB9
MILVMSSALLSAGCAAVPDGGAHATSTPSQSDPAETPSSSAPADAPESLGFAEGAQLDPMAMVGWNVSMGGDDAAWTHNPDAETGEVSFVNADGTCTAYYYQEVFETAAADDRSASDELLAEVAGLSADEVATYAADEYFVLTHASTPGVADGEVANRSVIVEADGKMWLMAARVFTNLDSAASQMSNAYSLQLACDADVDPLTQLSSLDEIAKVLVD